MSNHRHPAQWADMKAGLALFLETTRGWYLTSRLLDFLDAMEVHVTHESATRALNEMIEDGFVERRTDKGDYLYHWKGSGKGE
jgi:hypothetical protein